MVARSTVAVAGAIAWSLLTSGCGAWEGEAVVRPVVEMPTQMGFSRGSRSETVLNVEPGRWMIEASDPGEGVTIGIIGPDTDSRRMMVIKLADDAPLHQRTVTFTATGCDEDECASDERRSESYRVVLDIIDQFA